MSKLFIISTLIIVVCYFVIFHNGIILLSYAQEINNKTEYLTVQDVVEIAIENNPIIKSRRHNIETAEGRIRQANLLPNPEIELFTEEMPTDELGLGQSQNMVSLSQKLEIGGKRRLRVEAANKEKEIFALDIQIAIANVTAEVKKAFFDVLTTQDKIKTCQRDR